MKIKTGDLVKVISGNSAFKGKLGKIVSVDLARERVTIEGGPVHKRHLKPERSRIHPEGGIIEKPASIHISNVMLMAEMMDRPVRVGFIYEEGKKFRIAKGKQASGEKV
jgi:large subunit ribosomal protein L24